jgi:hypothetical protein
MPSSMPSGNRQWGFRHGGGRDELAVRVQEALLLPTKKQAQQIVEVVIDSLEATLLNNLGSNGFSSACNRQHQAEHETQVWCLRDGYVASFVTVGALPSHRPATFTTSVRGTGKIGLSGATLPRLRYSYT